MNAAQELANLILHLDSTNPGDFDASFDVAADVWHKMVLLATKVADASGPKTTIQGRNMRRRRRQTRH